MSQWLSRLEGTWSLARDILDLQDQSAWRFAGRSTWLRQGGGLIQRESGKLHSEDRCYTAERRYLWAEDMIGSDRRILVCFGDGTPLHAFDPAEPLVEATHRRAAVLYTIRYDFSLPDRWQSCCSVTGPRKRYMIHSAFTRLRPAPDPARACQAP